MESSIKESNVTILIKTMDRSVGFYQSLGFELKQRWEDHYVQLSAPGITLGLHLSEKTDVKGSGNVSIGFTTGDFEVARDLLNKLGIDQRLREEQGGQFVHFQDPDGTQLYFIKPKWDK